MEIEKDSETTKLAIEKLLKSEGIEEYDISSINCLNEFINSYLTDLIKSVKIKMNLTKKEKIDILLVASALKQKQNNMYQSKSSIYEMTYMANKINSFELPPIPETPVVLKPPILNNLLRNNFQIYSEDLNMLIKRKFDPNYDMRKNLPEQKGLEAKTNTAPMQRFVWTNGFGVITKGLCEYEVYKDTLSITLLRSTGIISKPDNKARTTPAGPPIKVPEAQQLGENSAEFSIGFYKIDEWTQRIEEIYPQTIIL